MVENKKCLVLNKDYTPMYLVSVTRAFTLWWKDRVNVVHEYDDVELRTPYTSFQAPSVVRVKQYVRIPYKKVPLTRQNIYRRDGRECVYCGSSDNLTLDHVIPQSKGGEDSWENLVTACKTCNHQKADKLIGTEDVNAYRPVHYFLFGSFSDAEADWKPYLFT